MPPPTTTTSNSSAARAVTASARAIIRRAVWQYRRSAMPDPYLVLFVADPAADEHAEALRGAARGVPEAGFFDDPDGGAQRTVGAYVRAREIRDGIALLQAVAAISRVLAVR